MGHPHIVYKRSSLKLPEAHSHCGVRGKPKDLAIVLGVLVWGQARQPLLQEQFFTIFSGRGCNCLFYTIQFSWLTGEHCELQTNFTETDNIG